MLVETIEKLFKGKTDYLCAYTFWTPRRGGQGCRWRTKKYVKEVFTNPCLVRAQDNVERSAQRCTVWRSQEQTATNCNSTLQQHTATTNIFSTRSPGSLSPCSRHCNNVTLQHHTATTLCNNTLQQHTATTHTFLGAMQRVTACCSVQNLYL